MTHRETQQDSKRGISPSEALRERIRSQIQATRSSTVRTRTRVIAAVAVAVTLGLGVLLIASELVYNQFGAGLEVDPAHARRLQWTTSLLVILTALSTVVALWRGKRGFGPGIMTLSMVAAFTVPVYAALTLLDPVHAGAATPATVTISPWGTRCAVIAGIVGIGVTAALASALRHAVPVATRLRGSAMGAAAGAWAGLTVFAFCPSGDRLHMLAGHLLPVVALLLLGALMTPRYLRP